MKYLNNWMLFETMNPNDIKKFNRKEKLKVYHRTKDANISLIGRDGFRSGFGNAWGDGIYTCYDLISTTIDNRYNSGSSRESAYGPVIIENEVLSLKDFLIFDYDAAKQYYGKDYSIKSQIEKIVPEEIYQKFLPSIEQAHLICLERRDNKILHSTDAVRQIYEIDEIMDHVRGIVFTGQNDGKVLLSYDRENIVPIRYSNDNGKTWNKIKDKGAYRKAKENFMDLIKSETKTDLIIDKIKDRINNFITTNFGPTKNLDNLNYQQIKSIKSNFDYIFNSKQSNLNSEKYKLYQKSLDTIAKEFEGYFKREFIKFKEYINKIDLSENFNIDDINTNFNDIYLGSIDKSLVDTESDEEIEILSKIKIKVLDIYEKKVLDELSKITKDDDFFSKFIEIVKKYPSVPSSNPNEILSRFGYGMVTGSNSLFKKDGGVISYIRRFSDKELVEKIISDISNNLIKKINTYLNKIQHSGLYSDDRTKFISIANREEMDDLFSKDDIYNSTFKIKINTYEKEVLGKISEIAKDDDFFSKITEIQKNYPVVPSEKGKLEFFHYTGYSGYSPFQKDIGVISYIRRFSDKELVENIISDISNNLVKKINTYLNKTDKQTILRMFSGVDKYSRTANINLEFDDLFSKDDIYNSTFKNMIFINYFSSIGGEYYHGDDVILNFQNAIETDDVKIDNFKKSILDSYDYFCKYISETCKEINGISDEIIDKDKSYKNLSDFIIGRFGDDTEKVKAQIIYTLLAMKDNTVLNKLASDGFLSDRSLTLLKLFFNFENNINNFKALDFQKSRSINEIEKQFNNTDYNRLFKSDISHHKNYELYKKLKSEGKDVSNWNSWIKILLLISLGVSDFNDSDLPGNKNYSTTLINDDRSHKDILNDLITLDINLFTDKTIEKAKKLNRYGETVYKIVEDISYKLFSKKLDIELYLSYLSKIKDTINEKYYTIAISTMIIQLINDENREKLKPLAQYLINNSLKKEFIDEKVINEDIVRVIFKYDLITLSDIIGKPISNDLIVKCANYKLRKLLKENNLEKIKSYLKFLKENKIDIYLRKETFDLEYDEIKLNELDFEIIDTMLMNDQIRFYDLSEVADDDLVIKTLKYIDKPNYDYMLKVIKDPNLKQKVEMELFSKTNNFDKNIDIFLKNYKKLDINKLIEDLNKTYAKSDKPVDIFDLINISLITDKKEELLNKIDKNIFTNINKEVIEKLKDMQEKDVLKFSELREEYVEKFPTTKEFFTLENFKITLESIYKYLNEEAKNMLVKFFKLDDKVSEKIILKFETFSKNF